LISKIILSITKYKPALIGKAAGAKVVARSAFLIQSAEQHGEWMMDNG
jgi:hypothetical protein